MFDIVVPEGVEQFHYENVKVNIVNEIEKVKKEKINAQFRALLEWLVINDYENLERVIIASPDNLLEIYEIWRMSFQFQYHGENVFGEQGITSEKYLKYFKQIFNYKRFCTGKKYSLYDLTKKLDVEICPYCNRQFTYTVVSDDVNIIRPEIDHYFPQSKYPMFALSLYNLIPCCHICNSNIKGLEILSLEKYYHPYIREEKNFSFYYTKTSVGQNRVDIDYNGSEKAEATCKFFRLDKIYNMHSNEADKIDELLTEFDDDLIEDIYLKLNKAGIRTSKKRLVEIIYSEYLIKDPKKVILGKLKNDMYEQIKKFYVQ